MARARRRYDIYRQPGLFDKLYEEPLTENLVRETGKVYIAGGDKSAPGNDEILPPLKSSQEPPLRYMSFGSGSSGNCAFLGNNSYGFLIDAGVDPKKVETDLNREGITMDNVVGIILTHDHSDHAGYVYSFVRNHRKMAVFCTPRTLNGLLRRHGISCRIKEYHHPIYKETPFNIKDFRLTAFEVSHDGTDNVGFFINNGTRNFVVATDMGFIGKRALYYMKQAHSLMLESDYDYEMLRVGHYPEYLKSRIVAQRGHLDNAQVAQFLREHWTPQMRNIYLCHLSKDNNTPVLAAKVAREALIRAGASKVGDGSNDLFNRDAPVQLYVLPRYDASPLFYIR